MRLHRFFDYLAGFTILFLVMVIAFLVYVKDRESVSNSLVSSESYMDLDTINVQTGETTSSEGVEVQYTIHNGYVDSSILSFSYDPNASITGSLNDKRGGFYLTSSDPSLSKSESITLYNGDIPDSENYCSYLDAHEMIIDTKVFIYCDSQADPERLYIYTDKGKSVMIADQNMSNIIELGSIKIK